MNVIITGILGQDGSNMAEYLLNNYKDITVIGIYKRGSNPNIENIKQVINNDRFKLVSGDITDQTSLDNLVINYQPDYFINFAANSFVGTSWDTPDQVFTVNTLGVLKCLEAIRKFKSSCKFYSAGSSEEFGDIKFIPQTEDHPITPVSPYAVAKAAARHLVDVYRRSYGLFAIHGTLFNHEGPRRGVEFVTRKITMSIAKVINQLNKGETPKPFTLGNIYSSKDWSDSRDMVRGVWMMLQQDTPKEFILASNKTRTIKEFVDICFKCENIEGRWINDADPLNEVYKIKVNDKEITIITIDKKLYRATEVGIQKGDYSKIKQCLGWEPQIPFEVMVKEMLEHDKNIIH